MRGCQKLFFQASPVNYPNGHCRTHGHRDGFSDTYFHLISCLVTFGLYFTFYMDADCPIGKRCPAVMPPAIIYCYSLQRQLGAWATSPGGA